MRAFLSYPAKSTLLATEIGGALKALGIDLLTFFDGFNGNRADVYAVNEWSQQSIESADALIVLITANSHRSRGLAQETVYAVSQGIPVVAVQVETDARVPFGLLSHDVLDVSGLATDEAAAQIAREVERTIAAREAEDGVRIGDQIRATARQVFQEDHPIARVFIAYSRKQRSIARALSELLAKRGQLHFWDAKIHAGATWRQTIQRALDDCTHLLVIWTKDAAQSDEVEREVSYALAEGKVIIPILSRDIPKLPYQLHGFHYIVLPEDIASIEDEIISAIESIPNEDIWQ